MPIHADVSGCNLCVITPLLPQKLRGRDHRIFFLVYSGLPNLRYVEHVDDQLIQTERANISDPPAINTMAVVMDSLRSLSLEELLYTL